MFFEASHQDVVQVELEASVTQETGSMLDISCAANHCTCACVHNSDDPLPIMIHTYVATSLKF